eukprot:7413268-Pyramimonas_sp.AAC.1
MDRGGGRCCGRCGPGSSACAWSEFAGSAAMAGSAGEAAPTDAWAPAITPWTSAEVPLASIAPELPMARPTVLSAPT